MSGTMRRITALYSRSRWKVSTFYVDSRDAVDDGAGKVASVTDRISGWSFAADSAGNKPKINTALLGGTQLILFDSASMNLLYTGSTSFGGLSTPVSFVFRVRRSTTSSLFGMSLDTGESSPSGHYQLQANSTTAFRFKRKTAEDSTNDDMDFTTTWSNNTWYTIGASCDGTTVRAFKDGVFISSDTPVNNDKDLGGIDRICLGNRGQGTMGANGLTGYYAVWAGWAGVAISDAQHLYEHNKAAAWAA
jgi:hypothetical protein